MVRLGSAPGDVPALDGEEGIVWCMPFNDQRVQRFVAKKRAVLATRDRTHSRLKSILHACGWKRRTEKNLRQIQEAFEEAGIYPEPMLTAPGLNWDEMIYFTREQPQPYNPEWYAPAHAFSNERALHRFLIQNFDRIPEFSHLKQARSEYQLPSGRKVDILCREKRSNDYVVIELKKEGVDPSGQLEKYLIEVDKKLAQAESPSVGVSGIIITAKPNWAIERELPDAIQKYPVIWFVFRAHIELFERIRVP